MKEVVNTNLAPAAIGPYSQACKANGLVFVSGQLPIDPKTGAFAGEDVKSQTKQSLENVKAILEAAGSSMDQVLKATCYLADINDFAAMNEVYATYFTGDCPARAAFAVKDLPKQALVEIEVVAVCS